MSRASVGFGRAGCLRLLGSGLFLAAAAGAGGRGWGWGWGRGCGCSGPARGGVIVRTVVPRQLLLRGDPPLTKGSELRFS